MNATTPVGPGPVGRIPMWVKVSYTAFMCVLVPFYWSAYGPTNFLYFCDLALLLTLVALWLENPLLASIAAVEILLPGTLWVADFITELCGGRITGMTAYMFKSSTLPFARALSGYHGWLPVLLVWVVSQLGYDRRALGVWTVLAWALMLVSYFCLPAPPAPAATPNLPVNVNYVYGPNAQESQTWMVPGLYLVLVMIGFPLLLFLPAHWILLKLFGQGEGVKSGLKQMLRW
jgi:hypothetical protein